MSLVSLVLTLARVTSCCFSLRTKTDAQARERAWRFGQEREVTIYRLITAGSVEEKIYQRQIFKTALSNKVLQDPRQRRLFSQKDLRDLFSLSSDAGSVRAGGDGVTDTGKVTAGVGVIGPDDEMAEHNGDDNQETLKRVMQSKGLAGVFDHHYVEHDASRKTTSVREMEDKAKKVAREALQALRRSTEADGSTTLAVNPAGSRFGSGNAPTVGSQALLASIRQRNTEIESDGKLGKVDDDTKRYAGLLGRLQGYVKRRRPTTNEILKDFNDEIPSSDVAVFRRLLKSIAVMQNGKWILK